MSLSAQQIATVKSTAPLLKTQGETITTRMYEILFAKYPQTEVLFAHAENQPTKLAKAIVAYATHIDKPENLSNAIEHIARKHVGAQVQPEHYPMVADALLTAMSEVLGTEVITAEVVVAWTAAYRELAAVFQAREAELYNDGRDG